jgi:hypothetical protein
MTDPYTIRLPVSVKLHGTERVKILATSPLQQRRWVELLARYFKNEMGFDFLQFEAAERESDSWYVPYVAWLFHEIAYDKIEEDKDTPKRAYGACCFRWREWENHSPCWALDWLWLHPYFRGRGYLKKHWTILKQEHRPFMVSKPVSTSMKRFLEKEGEQLPEIT